MFNENNSASHARGSIIAISSIPNPDAHSPLSS
jgi:hypothetical protein